jgi:hypothetical protein
MLFALFAGLPFAKEKVYAVTVGTYFEVTDGTVNEDYSWDDGDKVLTVLDGANISIANADLSDNKVPAIEIAEDATATVELDNLKLEQDGSGVRSEANDAPLKLLTNAGLNLNLKAGTNNYITNSGVTGAALQTLSGSNLTIDGSGSLSAAVTAKYLSH